MGKRKLSDEDKNTIRLLYGQGESIPALAARYGVAYVTIKRTIDPQFYADHLTKVLEYKKDNGKEIYQQSKLSTSTFTFRLNIRKDEVLIKKLRSQKNVNEYIRQLILTDIDADENADMDKNE